jgi:hypothetical protein
MTINIILTSELVSDDSTDTHEGNANIVGSPLDVRKWNIQTSAKSIC